MLLLSLDFFLFFIPMKLIHITVFVIYLGYYTCSAVLHTKKLCARALAGGKTIFR